MLLKSPTPPAWTAAVLADLDAFLLDHAANERKVSGSAMTTGPGRPLHAV